jgi:hypothetical protein
MALVFGFGSINACSSSDKGGKTTPPNKPPAPAMAYGDVCAAAGLPATVVTFEGSGICNGLAGFGSCLAEDEWYDDGEEIHDVWYCEAEGDTITLCACGDDFECTDSGSNIVCNEV